MKFTRFDCAAETAAASVRGPPVKAEDGSHEWFRLGKLLLGSSGYMCVSFTGTWQATWERAVAEFGQSEDDANVLRCMLADTAPMVVAQQSVPQLDNRETSLLKLLAQGKSIPEIVDELYLVEGTVKNRLSALYRKLGVKNRAQTVAKAQSMGLLGPSH